LTVLIRKEIKGQFLQNREGVENYIKALNASRKDIPSEELKERLLGAEKSKSPISFSMHLFPVDSSTGLFVAEGQDYFGKSGISGMIRSSENYGIIAFQKNYILKEPFFTGNYPEKDFNGNLNQFFYSGQYTLTSDGKFLAEGKYSRHGHELKYGGGTWKMEAKL